ncbi:hypothetical protein NDU88_003013 [Pleurodeles waltl]|uniref:Prolactin receptor n=1 Tax=Pleurodeles waltl TaxID=8319 RepID=A0AAV7UX91_PLEWA|nr:hypothetical protein NDU88_003013 [Pleurodeles waltl]
MDHLACPQVSMETPADADGVNFRSPGRKERMDSGDERKEEFSLKTPTGRDARGMPKTESEDPQVLGTREEGGNQTPKTSACRHDPGGSWLDEGKPPLYNIISEPQKVKQSANDHIEFPKLVDTLLNQK